MIIKKVMKFEIPKKMAMVNAKNIKDVKGYISDYINTNGEVKLFVGCDSKQSGDFTTYAVSAVLYKKGLGGHVVYFIDKVPRIRDMFVKLWGEVERTKEFLEYLGEDMKPFVEEVHLDFNPKPIHKSNMVHDAGVGLISSMGYKAIGKYGSWAASYCADRILKNK
jgi:predicted RNase H-related nuclease YkuK (DUF458 family)